MAFPLESLGTGRHRPHFVRSVPTGTPSGGRSHRPAVRRRQLCGIFLLLGVGGEWVVQRPGGGWWSWWSWCGWSIVHSCIASLTLRGQCVYHFCICTSTAVYVSLIACIHVVEALTILVAQSTCLIKALAGILLAIVFEAYEVLGRWELITSSRFGRAISFNAQVGASSSRSGNRRINSLNGAILELLSSRINTF